MARQRYTAQQVIDALRHTKGLIYLAADRLKCEAETIHNYARRYPTVQAEIDAQRGTFVDVAESKLHAAVNAGELSAVKYVLSTLGKNRGYVERSENEQRGEIILRVIYDDKSHGAVAETDE